MTGTERQLERVEKQITRGNVGLAIAEMETYLAAYPQQQTIERLSGIKAEYELMTNYWKSGATDPQLEQLYQHLLQRMYVLYGNIASYQRTLSYPALSNIYTRVRLERHDWSLKEIRKEMEDFVSNVAMLELEPPHTRETKCEQIYQKHQSEMNNLFNYILTSRMWSDGVGHDFEEILISPTIDHVDQQMMVSAVTLALLNQFDFAKFRTLVNVYRRSREVAVRQRALVGWTMSMNDGVNKVYPEQKELVWDLLQSKQVCEELTELQIQLVYTQNAERDGDTINKEIMPDLIKNADMKLTKDGDRFGIVERDENDMEDILHPEAAEERMQKLEASYNRMFEMQKQGSDIYFGGFSQMKRFPFFYDICNWLTPFFFQHPDIKHFMNRLKDNKFMMEMIQTGPFCNSDKYSFIIGFSQVLDRMPKHLMEMMEKGEASMVGMGFMEEEQLNSPATIRRNYLMDLYRFFRLYPNRNEFENPFDESHYPLGGCLFFELSVLTDSPLESYKEQVVKLLIRQKQKDAVKGILSSYSESSRNAQYYIWLENYTEALKLEPDNMQAKMGLAKQLFKGEQYAEALEIFDELLLLHPENRQFQLYKATCMIYLKLYEDALKMLYRLTYENPDNVGAKRALGWVLLCTHQLEQADKIFKELVNEERNFAEDLLNYGYSCWFSGRVVEAIDYLRRYFQSLDERLKNRFEMDSDLLNEYSVSTAKVNMMIAAIES